MLTQSSSPNCPQKNAGGVFSGILLTTSYPSFPFLGITLTIATTCL